MLNVIKKRVFIKSLYRGKPVILALRRILFDNKSKCKRCLFSFIDDSCLGPCSNLETDNFSYFVYNIILEE